MPELYFEVISAMQKRIRVTKEYWEFIVTVKHLTLDGREGEVMLTLTEPNEVRVSNKDRKVFIYYRLFGRLFLAVVCKHLNGEGYIITSYFTDRIKIGNLAWKKQT